MVLMEIFSDLENFFLDINFEVLFSLHNSLRARGPREGAEKRTSKNHNYL